jgi:hypothetical protein
MHVIRQVSIFWLLLIALVAIKVAESNLDNVGIILRTSAHIVSQLKCTMPSCVSRKIESCESKHIDFISDVILRATWQIISVLVRDSEETDEKSDR